MSEKHYNENLSEFVNHELAHDKRQAVAEHLLVCADCRAEHDEIKFGANLAGQIKQFDAPENLWRKIENTLDGKAEKTSLIPNFAFFGSRVFTSAAVLLIVCGLFAVFYFGLLRDNSHQIVKNQSNENQKIDVELPKVVAPLNEISTNQNSDAEAIANNNSNIQNQPKNVDSNVRTLPKTNPVAPKNFPNETNAAQNNLPSWNVETLAGTPKIGNSYDGEKLTVGEALETDANSKAKIQVANIGNVEISPNSRVRLVKTTSTEHRLSLEKGELKAKILAPPRLFIVDTPSAVAIDLGCEYTLEVDKNGDGKLHVTSGFVALERNGRESIVPAGAIAITKKGKGIGTPFSEDSSAAFQDALDKFDFENGGSRSLQTIVKEASLYDSITLWHLLSRVEKSERGKVFDALSANIKPPANVNREGILQLNKKMLDAWWKEIETVWFE